MIKHHCDICDKTLDGSELKNLIPPRFEMDIGGQELCDRCLDKIDLIIKQAIEHKIILVTNKKNSHTFYQLDFTSELGVLRFDR